MLPRGFALDRQRRALEPIRREQPVHVVPPLVGFPVQIGAADVHHERDLKASRIATDGAKTCRSQVDKNGIIIAHEDVLGMQIAMEGSLIVALYAASITQALVDLGWRSFEPQFNCPSLMAFPNALVVENVFT